MNSQPWSQGFLQEWFCFYKFFYPFARPMFFYTCSCNVKKCIKIEDYLSQGDCVKYVLKMAAPKVMYDMVTHCLHHTLMFVFCIKWV